MDEASGDWSLGEPLQLAERGGAHAMLGGAGHRDAILHVA